MYAGTFEKRSPVFHFFKLPFELREIVLVYVSLADRNPWIGESSIVARAQETGDETSNAFQSPPTSQFRPGDFIKTKHPFIFTCYQLADEYRAALWRSLMANDHRQVDVKAKGLSIDHAEQLLSCCSQPDREISKKDLKIRLRLDFTDVHAGGFTLWQRLTAMEAFCECFELVPAVVVDRMTVDDVFEVKDQLSFSKVLFRPLRSDTRAYRVHLFREISKEVNDCCKHTEILQAKVKWSVFALRANGVGR